MLIDGAQAVPHVPVDVQAIGADFYAFSGHKMLGPTGSGALWARRELLEAMPPFLAGGEMIREVHLRRSDFNDIPWKFEAGTPDIAAAIGFGAAAEYLMTLGMDRVREHERELTAYALDTLASELPWLELYGPMDADLRWIGALLFRNGEIEETGLAAGVLNHPANGIAWLANRLAPHDEHLAAGEVVLAGSFTRPVDIRRGDTFHADYGTFGSVSCQFV